MISPIIFYFQKDILELAGNDLLRFLLSLPLRIIQVLIAIFLWNTSKIFISLKNIEYIDKIALFCTMIITFIQIVLSYIIIQYFRVLPIKFIIIAVSLCILCIAANILLFRLIKTIKETISFLVKNEIDYNNNMSLKVLYGLIKKNEFIKAQELCEKEIKNKQSSLFETS